MGILDDAIREHLELKRQHGADRADVERLEQEAFGPVARPGDPEFDTGAEQAVPAAAPEGAPEEQAAAEQPVAEQPVVSSEGEDEGGFTDWFAGEEETTVAPAAEAQPVAEAPAAPEAPAQTPAEQARVEHPELGDTVDHPAPEQLGPADEAEPVPHEPSPSSEEQPAVEQPAVEQPAVEVPAAEEAPPEAPESDIFEGGEIEADEEEDYGVEAEGGRTVTPPPTTDHDLPPAPVRMPDEEEQDGEDLLEETPDFLQDAPEGEDLWFEQGPPQDFDFDDDDEED
jgi:hypothetical protein